MVPTGELHSLTSLYFENRRRAYASRRQPFVPMTHPSIDTGSQKDVHLTCHFICHKHGKDLTYLETCMNNRIAACSGGGGGRALGAWAPQ